MVIKITPKFTDKIVREYTQAKIDGIHKAYFVNLQKIGEDFVTRARKNDTYKDRTSNLRNSIGYVIFENGKQVSENFRKTGKGTEKSTQDGLAIGRSKAQEIAKNYPKGYVLVCIAGMNYAAAVESKGFDVISASSIEAKNELKDAIYQIYKIANGL